MIQDFKYALRSLSRNPVLARCNPRRRGFDNDAHISSWREGLLAAVRENRADAAIVRQASEAWFSARQAEAPGS